eukprot:348340-Rhodomonas_salina.1
MCDVQWGGGAGSAVCGEKCGRCVGGPRCRVREGACGLSDGAGGAGVGGGGAERARGEGREGARGARGRLPLAAQP